MHGIIGFIVLILSEILMFCKIEPFYTYFYDFAWWSYILILDGIIYKFKKESYIIHKTKEFFFLVALSCLWWLVFEAINLRIKNWYYFDIPREVWIRWPGYFIAYGTVLPGIFLTKEVLNCFRIFKNHQVKKNIVTEKLKNVFYIIGLLFFILPFIYPEYFFPLVWGWVVFLIEPVNYRYGENSILKDWENGSLRNLYLLLLAGIICGGLWEFWNFWSGAKWAYTVPFVGYLKIFEMPLLGFLGFPPFAVESYVFYNFVLWIKRKVHWSLILLIFLIFYFLVFHSIDTYTVKSFK